MPSDASPPPSVSILPLEARVVSFEAGGERLIKDLSFTLEAAKSTIVLGPNGAGKSLLLRLCHGLLKPSAGEIIWHGARGRDPTPYQAMVFQRPVMLRRSVAANVDYALTLRKIPRAQRRDLVEDALCRTGLERFARHPARVLSIGEQQRLALARAWALTPQVLFLDEPTANLDPTATHVIEQVITAFDTAGTKVIMTTHDLGQARRLADEIVFMHQGQVLEKSPADDFFSGPKDASARAFLRGELLWRVPDP
jgi:tungstate transport system ATP-binding protein